MTACRLCEQRPPRVSGALCGLCRAELTTTLAEAPALYVRGTQVLPVTSHAISEKLSTPKPGSRSPLRDGLLELCDALARGLAAWEVYTIHATGIPTATLVELDLLTEMGMVRPGYSVQRSAATVATHLDMALGPPYGAAHAGHVLGLTAMLRDRAGLTKLVHQLAAPCPHCDTRALVRNDGEDHVSCRLCRSSWPERDYAFLTRLLVAESGGKAS